MRPILRYFVDRDNELKALINYARSGKKVLVKGRRGVGKSVLVLKALELLEAQGMKSIYINCLGVVNGRDLLRLLEVELGCRVSDRLNNKEAFDEFFQLIESHNIGVVVLDEFTNLFQTLGRKKDFGNITNFAAVFRGHIMDSKASFIVTASSLVDLRKIVRKARIFGRTFDYVLVLDPFERKHALELVDEVARDINKEIPGHIKEDIIIWGDFVPYYIEALTRAYLLYGNLARALEVEFSSGTLAEYFSSLYEDLNPIQRAIMMHLGMGRKKFEELVNLISENGVPQALSELLNMDLVAKVVISKKNVFYTTKDRTFSAWILYNYNPSFTGKIKTILEIASLSFEAFVRETLGALNQRVRIIDSLGRELLLGPFLKVAIQKTRMGQIDVFAVDTKGNTIIGECYSGELLTKRKLMQIEKYRSEYPDAVMIFFMRGDIEQKAEQYAKQKEIYIIGLEELREIRKNTNLHPF